MEFECAEWTDPEGDPVSVSGTIVADVIQGFAEQLQP